MKLYVENIDFQLSNANDADVKFNPIHMKTNNEKDKIELSLIEQKIKEYQKKRKRLYDRIFLREWREKQKKMKDSIDFQ